MQNGNILIADSMDIARIGLRCIMTDMSALSRLDLHFFEVDDIDSLLSTYNACHPDVAIIESAMVDDSLTADLVHMAVDDKSTQWVFFASNPSRLLLFFVRDHANFSIILRDSSREEIQGCLRQALKGQQYICNECMKMLLNFEKAEEGVLTPAECMVLALLAQGLKPKAIADLQNRSAHTIRTHKKTIFEKLGVNSTLDAVMMAYKLHIINPPD